MADYEERRAVNDRSLNHAENHRQAWSAEEDDLLRTTMGEPIEDVAYVLGRSVFAVDMRRSQVRNDAVVARASFERLKPQAQHGEVYGDPASLEFAIRVARDAYSDLARAARAAQAAFDSLLQ